VPNDGAQRSIFGVGTSIAATGVVTASVASVLLAPAANPVALVACAAAYLVAVIGGVLWVERVGRGRAVLMAVLFVLGSAAVWISQGAAILLLMPLVSLFVLWSTLRTTIALTTVLGLFVVLVRWSFGKGTVMGGVSDFGSAAVFTVIFSRLIVKERMAAIRIERLAADFEAQNRQLSAYAAQIQELATVEERNRIAREIHDSLGHYLTSAHVQLEIARTAIAPSGSSVSEHVLRAQQLLREGMGEVRRSVVTLRSPTADRPLGAALRQLIDEARADGLAAQLHVRGAVRPLGPAVEFALYRAAQEALTNVRRHAHAGRADVSLHYRNADVVLRVEDDGQGGAKMKEGFGLVGVRERVELVGGELATENAEGGGLALCIRVPT
jgi:signal transduction histidine kinase